MKDGKYNIAIISDQTLRAKILSQIIGSSTLNTNEIHLLNTSQFRRLEKLENPILLLIDLMGTDKSSKQIILPIRNLYSDIKIIALHLYRSSILVNPLFNMGVQGYIYYEPSRKELVHAIQTVISGKKYIPKYLASA